MTRRSLLRGLGLSAGASPLFRSGRLHAQMRSNVPKRLVVVVTPEGFVPSQFWPRTSLRDAPLASLTLPPILAPLGDFRSQMLLLRGIENQAFTRTASNAGHETMMAQVLSPMGVVSVGDQSYYSTGTSFDQHIANAIGGSTRFASLQLGVQVNSTRWGRISFRGPKQALAPDEDPYAGYAKIFGSGFSPGAQNAEAKAAAEALLARRRSVLDYVTSNVSSLSARLGADDRQRLQGHLESIRSVERSLMNGGASASASCAAPTFGTKIDVQAPDNYPMVARMQLDLLAAAVTCDATRVATLQLSHGSSKTKFTWLGVTEDHHTLAHSAGDRTDSPNSIVMRDKLTKIGTWFGEQVAYLARKLAAVREADGRTLLDHTLILWISDMGYGAHSPSRIPVVLLGGNAATGFRYGRMIEYGPKTTDQYSRFDSEWCFNTCMGQPTNNLFMTLANALGAPTQTFGDPKLFTGALTNLV